MGSSWRFLSILAIFAKIASSQQSGWQDGQVNTTMCYWQLPRTGVIRDTLYIDGGYLFWQPGLSSGEFGAPAGDDNPLGLVYTLNFSVPWSTSQNFSNIFTTLSGNGAGNNVAPQYYDGTLFANDYGYWGYGGLLTNTDAYTAPDGDTVSGYEQYNSGPSSKQFSPGPVNFNELGTYDLTRYVTSGGGVSIPGENLGYYFSGLRAASHGEIYYGSGNETTLADVVSDTLIGINMTNLDRQGTPTWSNSTLPSNITGRANPELVWIPVSDSGALIAIGGVIYPQYATIIQMDNSTEIELSQATSPSFMSTVSIYDIAKDAWYSQETTGDIPGQLAQGCSVVASAPDNSSHNIYWYGGFDGINASSTFSDDVWVLSVPSFVWTKLYSGNSTHGRAGHRCVKPYPDQMFVVGGYTSQTTEEDWPACIEGNIVQNFNLSSGEWLTSYSPLVWSNYTVPSAIVSKIGGTSTGGSEIIQPSPSGWSDPALATVFGTEYAGTPTTNWYPYNLSSPSSSSTSSSSSSSSGGLPSWVGPVLGVVLGLLALGAIIAGFLLWRRRQYKKRRGSTTTAETPDTRRGRILSWVRGQPMGMPPGKAMTVTSEATEAPTSPYSELEGPSVTSKTVSVSEVADQQIYEMPDTSQPQELSSTGLNYFTNHNNQLSASPSIASSTYSRPGVSPILNSARPDSPALPGAEAHTRSPSRVVSEVSFSNASHLRSHSDVSSAPSDQTNQVGPIPEEEGVGTLSRDGSKLSRDGSHKRPPGAYPIPVSPPTPHQPEPVDYLSAQRGPVSPSTPEQRGLVSPATPEQRGMVSPATPEQRRASKFEEKLENEGD